MIAPHFQAPAGAGHTGSDEKRVELRCKELIQLAEGVLATAQFKRAANPARRGRSRHGKSALGKPMVYRGEGDFAILGELEGNTPAADIISRSVEGVLVGALLNDKLRNGVATVFKRGRQKCQVKDKAKKGIFAPHETI